MRRPFVWLRSQLKPETGGVWTEREVMTDEEKMWSDEFKEMGIAPAVEAKPTKPYQPQDKRTWLVSS